MPTASIHVHRLGKEYRIGGARIRPDTLGAALKGAAMEPFRRARAVLQGRASQASDASFWALRDVTFDVPAGQVLGLIGRNGAGKSTLLKILARITDPTQGAAKLLGRVGSLLEVGTGFHGDLTGRENVFLNGAILGMSRREIDRCYDGIVRFAEVERFMETPVKRYSTGMQLRLAFSVAAHLDAEILLVDEVLAVGDAAFQKKCLGKMGSITNEGRTVILVSHNMGAITSLADRCIWLDRGRIRSDGDAHSVVRDYLTRLTADGEASAIVELGKKPALQGNRERMELERLYVLDSAGGPTTLIHEGEPFVVRVIFRVKAPVENVELALNVRTVDGGTSLFMIPSGSRPSRLERGRYACEVQVDPNPLREGAYALGLYGFLSGGKEHVVNPACQLSVGPRLQRADDPFWTRWATGFFRLDDHRWGPICPVNEETHAIQK